MTPDATLDAGKAVARFWGNQIGGIFLTSGSQLSLVSLLCTLLLAAFLAVPRGRRVMPRLAVWRRALFPRRVLRSASGRADFGYFLFSLLATGVVLSWSLMSGGAIAVRISRALDVAVGPVTTPALPVFAASLLLTVALFVAFEFAYWLDHYLSHKIAFLWQFHRVHHAAESLSLFTVFRVHPVDTIVFANMVAIMTGLTGGVLGYLLGPAVQAWSVGGTNLLIVISTVCLTHLQHSHLWVTFGPCWGRHVLSPAHHQIHHSADPRHFDRNFGSTLALFDRVFGTLHIPTPRREALRFGLEDAVVAPHGWRAALIEPFGGALALLVSPIRPTATPAE